MPSIEQSTRLRTKVAVLLIAVGVVAIVFVLWNSVRRVGSMTAAAAGEQEFAQTNASEKTKTVIEIDSAADGTIKGKLLQKKSETLYARTDTSTVVHSNPQTKIVMGKDGDVRPGAVVHVTGVTGKDRSIAAEQIVVLTGYVKVQ